MADKLYTIVNGEPSELDLGTGGSGSLPGIDERVTALEEYQTVQDEAITTAQQSANAAQSTAQNAANAASTAQTTADSKVATVNGLTPDANGNVDVGGMPLGMVLPYTGKNVPAGTLRADGTTYTNMRASFPDFYAWVVASGLTIALASYTLVEGSCGYYGLDESAGTVRMPTLAADVFGTTTASLYGQAVAAGLPGITGVTRTGGSGLGTSTSSLDYTTGAFALGAGDIGNVASGISGDGRELVFDASRSNAIYGKSNTVTPSHVKYPWVIVVYNAATSASVAEAAEFVGLLDGKADKAHVAAIKAYITESWSSGTEWYRKWSDGWIEQGGYSTTHSNTRSISLHTAFTTTNYHVYLSQTGDDDSYPSSITARTTTTFTLTAYNTSGRDQDYFWNACGY